jgi:histone-lysine N-methyltransferase SUV420H
MRFDPFRGAQQDIMRAQINGSAVTRLEDDKNQALFRRHLQMYASLSMRDCPFKITTTTRYTGTSEASITARRDIKAREEIKYLVGVQVAINDKQE